MGRKEARTAGELYVISFSGGRTSAYMTEQLLKRQLQAPAFVCFANTGKEEPATLEFVRRCDEHWGGIIHWLEYDPDSKYRIVSYETASRNGEPYAALIAKRRYLPNVVARFCTQDLKIRPMKHFIMSLGHRYWTNVVGIRYDEPLRWAKTKNIGQKERWDTWLPLVDWKVTKPMVLDYWQQMPFDLQLKDYEGNCDLCFLKGKGKLQQIIQEFPEKADWWIEQEMRIGGTFHKGYSYQQLIALMKKSPTLFHQTDDDIQCICNID